MNIDEERVDDVVVVRMVGRLDTSTAPQAQASLDRVVDAGAQVVVVDLVGVDFMSSAGLRVLLAAAKRLRPKGSLRLFGLNPTVKDVFVVSGFSMIVPVCEDESTALAGCWAGEWSSSGRASATGVSARSTNTWGVPTMSVCGRLGASWVTAPTSGKVRSRRFSGTRPAGTTPRACCS